MKTELKTAEQTPILHVAGSLIDGVQRCVVCGYVLQDYRNAMMPEGSKPIVWSSEGFVAVRGNMKFSVEDEFEGLLCKYLIV